MASTSDVYIQSCQLDLLLLYRNNLFSTSNVDRLSQSCRPKQITNRYALSA